MACRSASRSVRTNGKIAEGSVKTRFHSVENDVAKVIRDTQNLLRQLKDDDTCPMSLLHSHGREKCARDYVGSAGASHRVVRSHTLRPKTVIDARDDRRRESRFRFT